MNILIIRLSSMGDVILTASLFSYIKKNEHSAGIHFVTFDQYKELFADDERLESVTGISKEGSNEQYIKDLKRIKWDRIVDLQNNKRSRKLLKMIDIGGCRVSVLNKLRLQRCCLLLFRYDCYPYNNSVILRYIEAAGYCNTAMNDVPRLKINYPDTIINKSMEGLPISGKYLGLFPFSKWRNKEWPAEYYIEVAKDFKNRGFCVLIFGGPRDRENADKLRNQIGGNAVSLAGRRSLYEAGAVISRCTLALGNDTGLSHLARACGVKTGIIYGSTTSHFGFFPYGRPEYAVFQSKRLCRPCHAHGGNLCIFLSRPCLSKIYPEEVISGLDKMVK